MRDETHQLLRSLQDLLDSCADHDMIMDTLITPANPGAYYAALKRIGECITRISASGMTREELARAVLAPDSHCSMVLDGVLDPIDLVPLMGVPFSGDQQEMIIESCREWASSISPRDPENVAVLLHSAIHPITLAELLTPEVTRMQRFPTIILLQNGGSDPLPELGRPGRAPTRILLPVTDDNGLFGGILNQAIFRFLVQNGIINEPCFPDLIFQVLEDIGVNRGLGDGSFRHSAGKGLSRASLLQEAGRDLFRQEGSVRDIRILFRTAFPILAAAWEDDDDQQMERLNSPDCLEKASGHVLAGFISASQDSEPTGSPASPGRGGWGVQPILNIINSADGQISGQGASSQGSQNDPDPVMHEIEQLLRVVTGEYHWRAVPAPTPLGSCWPVIHLWLERHLILCDRQELTQQSAGIARALAMEALYRSWFGLYPEGDDLDSAGQSWLARLVAVINTRPAARKGVMHHPGALRWLELMYREEASLINRLVERVRARRLSLADQFLAAALYEARTEEKADYLTNLTVIKILDSTRKARQEAIHPLTSDSECLTIIRTRIWPAFSMLCNHPVVGSDVTGIPDGRPGKGGGAELVSSGAAPWADTTVPSPHKPVATTHGRSIPSERSEPMDNDDYSMQLAPRNRDAAPSAGNLSGSPSAHTGGAATPGTIHQPGGSGRSAMHNAPGGISGAADEMVQECAQSKDLLEMMCYSNKGHDSRNDAAGVGGSQPVGLEKAVSELKRKAQLIEDLAGSLLQQLQALKKPDSQPLIQKWDRQRAGKGNDWEDLLNISRKVCHAAREYKTMLDSLDPFTGSGGSKPDSLGSRTAMTREALEKLQEAGTELQHRAGASTTQEALQAAGPLQEAADAPVSGNPQAKNRISRPEPGFMPTSLSDPELWENLSYFDSTFSDDAEPELRESPARRISRDRTERQFEQGELALTREAEQYLSSLRTRTRSEWETIDEKAERIRQIALFETHAVGEDDYATYQRFFQPVAGLIAVTRKNIQQALQKNRATRDLTELTTGDDIDEENLAAVRTTMRIFKDAGRKHDKTRWCLSLLIDASSSMHDESVAKKLQATLQTTILFGEAVNNIKGIRFEIAAFTDSEYIPLKRYQDDWNIHQGCYLIRQIIQASGGTNDVGAISSALDRMHRLRMGPAANRMIFVISDGQSGVGGREQLKTIQAMHRETRIFGWGIGPDMEKVEETYRPYGAWVPDIVDLPGSIGEVLRRELTRPAMVGWKDDQPVCLNNDDTERGEGTCTN